MQEDAQIVALRALSWLVSNDTLLPIFLGSTGAGETDLKERAGEPEFLASVLDFLLMDDTWIIAFCGSAGLPGEAVMRARAELPGGALPHWT